MKKSTFSDSTKESQLVDPMFVLMLESPTLRNALDDQISSFKEMVVEDGLLQQDYTMSSRNSSFEEKARSLGSFLAHETLDGISQLASFVPQLAEEIKNIGGLISPIQYDEKSNSEHFQSDPADNYENLISAGHQQIDQLFSTDQSGRYAAEAKANQMEHFSISLLPPPGILGFGSSSMSAERLPATQASNVWGWSVGQKINNRTFFGTIPKWSTVRRRYWKNQAHNHAHRYENHELDRMRSGLAPQRLSDKGVLESKELHHIPAQKDGGLFDFIELGRKNMRK